MIPHVWRTLERLPYVAQAAPHFVVAIPAGTRCQRCELCGATREVADWYVVSGLLSVVTRDARPDCPVLSLL